MSDEGTDPDYLYGLCMRMARCQLIDYHKYIKWYRVNDKNPWTTIRPDIPRCEYKDEYFWVINKIRYDDRNSAVTALFNEMFIKPIIPDILDLLQDENMKIECNEENRFHDNEVREIRTEMKENKREYQEATP